MMRAILYILLLLLAPLVSASAKPDAKGKKREAVEAVGEVKEAGVPKGALLYSQHDIFNFGTVNHRGDELRHTFYIENRGDEPLIIKRVERSCSCMKVSISRKPIDVGERREMKVTYEQKKMPPGPFSKVVQIYSTSSDGGFNQFTIIGRAYAMPKSKE